MSIAIANPSSTKMKTIDERIREARQELLNIRIARREAEQTFYDETEELRCGLYVLRSRIYELFNQGVDFQIFQDTMGAVNNDEKNPVPYISMHFGHQVLLLSAIHQIELRKNMTKQAAKSGQKMVKFLEAKKAVLEQESAAFQISKKIVECDRYVVDDSLAQTVVAQRLVIRKLRLKKQRGAGSSTSLTSVATTLSGSSTATSVGRLVHVPIHEMEDVPMDDMMSPCTAEGFDSSEETHSFISPMKMWYSNMQQPQSIEIR